MNNTIASFQRILTSLLIVVFVSGFARGFDTGPHFDLTRSVLAEHQFADDPIKIAQVENWLTDYYSSSPTISKSKRESLEKLHFDNLVTTEQIKNYWGWLIANLKTESQKAAVDNDPFRMLMIAGIGLHAAQDFYTHSNWVESHARYRDGAYRTDTFLSSNPAGLHLFTGKYPSDRKTGPGPDAIPAGAEVHGDYEKGVNKDSPVRLHWDEAYVFAYVASHELVSLMEKWAEEARPGFWKNVREYTIGQGDTDKLNYDVSALRNMSMWIKGKGQNGHWKGSGSGSSRFFSAFSGKWVGKNSSRFVKSAAAGTLQADLAKNLYTNTVPPPLPQIGPFALKRRAIIVRATRIAEVKDTGKLTKPLNSTGGTDFYARVKIGGQEYWDRTMQASRDAANPWFEVHFVDQAERFIPITISVWDEDDIDSLKDQAMDINPSAGKSDLDLFFRTADNRLTGDINGIFSTPVSAFSSEGAKTDSKRARISAFVTQSILR
jgi:hypothetical protein